MVRYATKERIMVCMNCDLKFAERHALPLQDAPDINFTTKVLGIVLIRCPRCKATHRDPIAEDEDAIVCIQQWLR